MKSITIFLPFILLNLNGFSQDICRLVVKVENIKEVKGSLKYAVYDHREKFLKVKDAFTFGNVEIVHNTMTFVVDSMKSGDYAVSIFHDENNNGELDTNFIGVPTEPYAFSNNAKGRFGPPRFEDCQFELEETTQIIIEL
ncbi:MAG: DUF2141 domain-containing protein [Ekhidna sp.]|nr:DUF2141 domain-containing protein [Ekhidna sp.]MBC6409554.1 DUF2141 domain-containing protein [Ekhidna sp.]MBC6425718.1 DUF2141 domain-containing protein [Ekhidna sp.]